MSRAQQRRSNARIKKLSGLAAQAANDPDAFDRAIRTRLESWCKNARSRANTGKPGLAHKLADDVELEMQGIIANLARYTTTAEDHHRQVQDTLVRTESKLESLRANASQASPTSAVETTSLTMAQLARLRALKRTALRGAATAVAQVNTSATAATEAVKLVTASVRHVVTKTIAQAAKSSSSIQREDKHPYVGSREFLAELGRAAQG
jgi:tRNA G10  N-methylase Trm11